MANSICDFFFVCVWDWNYENKELNIGLITLWPEGIFLRICFDHLICVPWHRGLWILADPAVIWQSNEIKDPQVQWLVAVQGLCYLGSAVLTGDAFFLTCCFPQLAFKLFLSFATGIVLFLFLCHSVRAAREHVPAIRESDELDWGLFNLVLVSLSLKRFWINSLVHLIFSLYKGIYKVEKAYYICLRCKNSTEKNSNNNK